MIGVGGNNAEQHTLTKIRALLRVVAYKVKKLKIISVVGNNVEHFSAMWATTQFAANLSQFAANLPHFAANLPQFAANLPHFAANLPQFAANLPQFAANLPSGRMSPPTERDVTPPPSSLPALAPQPRGGASNRVLGRSAAAHPTPSLLASPHRVEGLRLAGAPPSPLPANVTRNVEPAWASTRAGSSDTTPSILSFMSLYDICVATGHAARVSVNHSIGFQDVTLFCRFTTQATAADTRKRRRRRQICAPATVTACPSPVIAPTASACA
jgi:hypothetical protein